MALDYYRVREKVPCTVNVAYGDASPEDVQIYGVCVRKGEKQKSLLKTSLPGLNKSGDACLFEWDTTGALQPSEISLEYAIEARGAELWGRRKVVIFEPDYLVCAVDNRKRPIEGATCRLKIKVDPDFLLSGRAYAGGYEVDEKGARCWTATTDRNGQALFSDMPAGIAEVEWIKPYVLSGARWKAEGEFTLAGPKRKAEVKKTPIIHYAWWGSSPQAPSGIPNQVAQLQTTVHYWTNSSVAGLNSEIRKELVDDARALLADKNGICFHSAIMGQGANLESILNSLEQYKLEPVLHAIVRLCILYREGGYCFDPRAGIASAGAIEGLTPHDSVRVLRPAGGSDLQYRFFPNDRSPDGTYRAELVSADKKDEDPPGAVRCPVVAWRGMYAPRHHLAVLIMIHAFIERAAEMGLCGDPRSARIATTGWAVRDVMTGNLPDVANPEDEKNRLAGNLIASSIQEGLWRFAEGNAGKLAGLAYESGELGLGN
jgi:hypothetical protein